MKDQPKNKKSFTENRRLGSSVINYLLFYKKDKYTPYLKKKKKKIKEFKRFCFVKGGGRRSYIDVSSVNIQ